MQRRPLAHMGNPLPCPAGASAPGHRGGHPAPPPACPAGADGSATWCDQTCRRVRAPPRSVTRQVDRPAHACHRRHAAPVARRDPGVERPACAGTGARDATQLNYGRFRVRYPAARNIPRLHPENRFSQRRNAFHRKSPPRILRARSGVRFAREHPSGDCRRSARPRTSCSAPTAIPQLDVNVRARPAIPLCPVAAIAQPPSDRAPPGTLRPCPHRAPRSRSSRSRSR